MSRIRRTGSGGVIVARSSRSDVPNWWRVYGDGWCEQGGQIAATPYYEGSSSTGQALNLLIPMETTDYHSSVHCAGVNNDWGNVANEILDARTAKTINVVCNDTAATPDHTDNKLIWEVKGWISNETLANIKAGKTWNPSTETWS